jgi:hypothetical protein
MMYEPTKMKGPVSSRTFQVVFNNSGGVPFMIKKLCHYGNNTTMLL